jgi:hypothetical protein
MTADWLKAQYFVAIPRMHEYITEALGQNYFLRMKKLNYWVSNRIDLIGQV